MNDGLVLWRVEGRFPRAAPPQWRRNHAASGCHASVGASAAYKRSPWPKSSATRSGPNRRTTSAVTSSDDTCSLA